MCKVKKLESSIGSYKKKFMKKPACRFFVCFLLALLVTITLIISGCQKITKHPPEAFNGTLDLTRWDFASDGPVKLNGEWEFYWEQLLEPEDFAHDPNNPGYKRMIIIPRSWNGYEIDGRSIEGEGFATFRLKILLPQDGQVKSISLSSISTAHKLWIDGRLVSALGEVAANREGSVPKYFPRVIPLLFYGDSVELVLQASNFSHRRGGIWQPLILGNSDHIQGMRERQLVPDMILLGSLLIMGLYHLAVYMLRRKDKAPLCFGMFCLLMALRISLVGQIILLRFFPDLSQELILKLEYFTYYLGVPLFVLYLYFLFTREVSKKAVVTYLFISIGFSLHVLLTPARVYSQFLYSYDVVALIALTYIFVAVLLAVIRKREGAMLVLIGFGVFVGTAINDILYYSEKPAMGNLVSLGVFVFIFAQAFILSSRFSKAFSAVEQMSEKLLSMDKLKDQFLANVSHELLTPLNGMIGVAESILAGADKELNEKQKNNLFLIISSGRRLGKLVDDLLDYSRLKNNDIVLQVKPVDIKQIVQTVIALSRPFAVSKSLELHINIPQNIPSVEADENRLQQILYNLLGNAIKFTSSGSVTVSAIKKGRFVEMSVTDTGMGIPVDQQDRIFNSYEQGDQGILGQTSGVGLGLSITKTLVELHGGTIRVKSEPQKGSRFIFTLPASNQSPKRDSTQSKVTPGLNLPLIHQLSTSLPREANTGFRIIIVDDEPVNLQVLSSQLSLEQHTVITASSGGEALNIVKESPELDLMVLDVMLPDLSGYDVCRRIREKYSLLELPILMLTARNRTQDVLLAFEAGANDYLSKPFERSEMLARVKTLLTLKKAMKKVVIAELQFLQAQIKPHFIFNTLNIIMFFCRTDPNKAAELLDELGNYLRGKFSLINMEQLIPLDKELEFAKSYLALEQARFEERLKVIYNIETDVNVDIPPLTLQPLVENAVKHGIYPKKEGGRLEISVWREEQTVFIQVKDNGVGMTPKKPHRILSGQDRHAGIGLQNVNKRLINYFECGLLIQSEIDKGTTVTIRIPLRT